MQANLVKNAALALAAALLLLSSSSALAQFPSLGKLTGGGTKAEAPISLDAFSQSSAETAGQVLAARLTFLDAQAKLMAALGLKTDAIVKASEALRAKEGAATSTGEKVAALKDSSKATAGANKEFEEALTKSDELSAESKVKFAEGSGRFIEGVLLEKAQIETITKLVGQGKAIASSASLMEKMKVANMVRPVTDLSSMVPGDVKEGTSTLGKIMKFAKSQNITNIPNSEKATASLGEL